jgi:hypothetical protein
MWFYYLGKLDDDDGWRSGHLARQNGVCIRAHDRDLAHRVHETGADFGDGRMANAADLVKVVEA